MYIELIDETALFLSYDQPSRTLTVKDGSLYESLVGTYNVTVQIGYGSGDFKQRHNVTM